MQCCTVLTWQMLSGKIKCPWFSWWIVIAEKKFRDNNRMFKTTIIQIFHLPVSRQHSSSSHGTHVTRLVNGECFQRFCHCTAEESAHHPRPSKIKYYRLFERISGLTMIETGVLWPIWASYATLTLPLMLKAVWRVSKITLMWFLPLGHTVTWQNTAFRHSRITPSPSLSHIQMPLPYIDQCPSNAAGSLIFMVDLNLLLLA